MAVTHTVVPVNEIQWDTYFYSTVVGFDESFIHLGPNNRSALVNVTAQILLTTPGAPLISTGFHFIIRRLPKTLPDSKLILILNS